MKIGALARRTGLSIRTLHYYDDLGLLKPSRRTEGRHREYDAADVRRLQQILSLRALGFSLEAIRESLDDPQNALSELFPRHLAHLEAQMAEQQAIHRRLKAVVQRLETGADLTVDELIQTMEAMTRYEKYYSEEQLRELEQRAKEMGPEGMQRAQDDWQEIMDGMRRAMESGTNPSDAAVQRLADRALELIQAFTGGNPGIANSLNRMYQEEGPETASHGMMDRALWDYMQRAYEVARKREEG